MNQINDGKLYCLPFWNQIASHQQRQVGYRRRNRSANGCPPTKDCSPDGCLLLTKIPLKYYQLFDDSGGKHLIR
ncbi:MAG: hypothetical protein LBL62_03680 [Planctomycetaceae bacterium]|nr:hypothetical protein [Planctomycetaceae bacterium]